MTFRTVSLASFALLASLVGAQAEESDRASSPLAAFQQSVGVVSAPAVVVEGRQSAPVVAAPAVSERDRFLIERNAGERH